MGIKLASVGKYLDAVLFNIVQGRQRHCCCAGFRFNYLCFFFGILITRHLLDVVVQSVSIRPSYQLRAWRLQSSVPSACCNLRAQNQPVYEVAVTSLSVHVRLFDFRIFTFIHARLFICCPLLFANIGFIKLCNLLFIWIFTSHVSKPIQPYRFNITISYTDLSLLDS